MGLAPRGAGGLKLSMLLCMTGCAESRPARGGWIEINLDNAYKLVEIVSPREGRVD